MLGFKPAFLLSFTFIKRLFNFSSLSAIQVVLSAYLGLLFLPAILIPACESSSPAFCMMYSAYKLNKQSDNTQPPIFLVYSFPNFEPVRYCVSSSNCCFTLGFWLFIAVYPWRREWQPLQYSCLENPTDRGTWQGVAKSRTGLTKHTRSSLPNFPFVFKTNFICPSETFF